MSSGRLSLELLRWLVAWWLLWRIPRPAPVKSGAPPSRSSFTVVIPARNEEENLARLLPSLEHGADVIVVDDHSSDATSTVAREFGVQVVSPPALPEGWTGKAWACASGASVATGERLVFLDADVVVEPGGMDRVLAEHERSGGLLSVQPWHSAERPYEQLSAFFNLIAPMSVDAFTPLGRRLRPTGAFGPCLVVDRDLYAASGGHGAPEVRGAVLDDVGMARAVRRAGGQVRLLGGRGSLRFRMYPEGIAQLTEGWTKNFAGGAAGTRPLTLVLVLAWVSGLIASTVALGPGDLDLGPAAAVYSAYVIQLAVLLRRVGRFGWLTAALFPIPLAFFLLVFLRSALLTFVRREVRWRGRAISTRSR